MSKSPLKCSRANRQSVVPITALIEAVAAVVGEGAAKDLLTINKPDAVATGAALLAGTRWLLMPLRPTPRADRAAAD